MQNRELRFIVRVQNEARAALARLRKDLAGVGTGANQANKGARSAASGNKALQDSAERARKSLDRQKGSILNLANSMKLLVGYFGIREAVALSDQYTNISNRIKVVSKNTDEAALVMKRLEEVARVSRSSLEGTAQIYQKTAQAAKVLGINSNETLQFTESLNKAVIISGASAQEAEGALIQLGQGLGSGVLQGDELRAVLEQLPYVARILAKEVGVETPGQLKKLAAAGKLTSRDIVVAFQHAKDEIEEQFKKMAPTIGQSLQVLKDKAMVAFGEFMNGSGIASGIATALLMVADNFDLIAKAAMIAGVTMATIYVGRGIGNALSAGKKFITTTRNMIKEQYALNMALGASSRGAAGLGVAFKMLQRIPLLALVAGVVALVSAFVELTSAQKVSKDSASTMGDVYGVAFRKLGNEISTTVKDGIKKLGDLFGVDINVDNWRDAILGIAKSLDKVGGYIEAFTQYTHARFGEMGDAIGYTAIQIYNFIVDKWINPALQTVTDWVNKIIQLGAAIAGGISGALSVLPDMFRAIFQNAMAAAATVVQNGMNGIIGALNLIPGVDITPKVDLVAMTGGFTKLPSIAAAAGRGARDAYAANASTFTAPQVARLTASAEMMAGAAGKRSAAAWERGMAEGIANFGVEEWWTDVFDEAEQQAKDKAAAAAAAAKGMGEDVADPDAAAGKDKKKGKDKKDDAAKKLKDQISDLMKTLFPARERMKEFNEKMALLGKVTFKSAEDMDYAKQRLRELYGDLSGPLGDFNRDLDDQEKLMGLTGDAAEEMATRLSLTKSMWEDGPIDDNKRALIENAVQREKIIRVTKAMTEVQEDLNKTIRAMNLDSSLLGKGYTDAQIGQIREVEQKRLELMEDRGLAGKSLAEMDETQLRLYAQINVMVDEYALALDRARAAERAQRGDAMAGLRDGLEQWRDQTSNMYGMMSDLASSTLNGMTDVVTNFVTTGKAGFKDFARSLIASISQIIIKMLLLRAISSFLPGFGISGATVARLSPLAQDTITANPGIFHKGGMGHSPKETRNVAASLFTNATRLHSGGMGKSARRAMGLRSGERPAIILENERVLNPEETKAYNAGQAASGMAAVSNGLQGSGSGNPQQIVLAPQFHNDFSGVAQQNGLSPEEAKQANKALEDDMNSFMERWVQREMRPGGRLAAKR